MRSFSPAGSTISERIAQIRQMLPDSVRLIAVTKQVSIAAMREAYAAGVRDFGESRVQEAEAKQAELADLPDITWHLIGHLQTNKVQRALELFAWIHSVDSLKLAQRLDRLAAPLSSKPKVCLQIKLRSDPSKFGWSEDALWAELSELNRLEHLEICGLMTIPPVDLPEAEIALVFQQLRHLAEQLRQQNLARIHMQELSMGMSNDYQFAVDAGATMIRLGRVLFGDRSG